MNLSQNTATQLLGFGLGVLSASDLEEWVIAADDDEQLFRLERAALRELRLLLLENGEGERDLSEVVSFVWGLLTQNGMIPATNSNVTTAFTVLVEPEGSTVLLTTGFTEMADPQDSPVLVP